jgi:hypothetical protein
MDSLPSVKLRGSWMLALMTAILAFSAAITLGFWLVMAVGEEDTDALESPLMLSVSRQLAVNLRELYGPFGGQNPLVLIHAPLYYRLAALSAWPLAKAGLDPVMAARLAGRSLSLLGLVVTLVAAYRLARLDGAPRHAGWWAVLLVAAMPVLSGHPVAVRPDMVGVALQTAGVLQVLTALREDPPSGGRLAAAYAAFGLAACVKQHFVVAAAISMVLLLSARRVRVSSGVIARSVLVALGIVVAVYGLEGLATRGRVWQAAFVVAGSVGQIHPGGWGHVKTTFAQIILKSIGLIALLLAAGVAIVESRPGILRRVVETAGNAVIALIFVVMFFSLFSLGDGAYLYLAGLATMTLFIPALAWIERQPFVGGQLDAVIWAYCVGELALTGVLCQISSGAWSNYAIQGVVFACVLTARALARAFAGVPRLRQMLPLTLAALSVLASGLLDVTENARRRRIERAAVDQIVSHMKRPRSEYFFTDRPGLNRAGGRLDLVYDDWLYPVFESLSLAEPRSIWLRRAMTSAPVRVIVSMSERPRIASGGPPVSALGYHPAVQVGRFFVWVR